MLCHVGGHDGWGGLGSWAPSVGLTLRRSLVNMLSEARTTSLSFWMLLPFLCVMTYPLHDFCCGGVDCHTGIDSLNCGSNIVESKTTMSFIIVVFHYCFLLSSTETALSFLFVPPPFPSLYFPRCVTRASYSNRSLKEVHYHILIPWRPLSR